MNRKAFELFQLSSEKEKKLWKEAIFIFDSSVLLNLYFFPESTRKKFFEDLISKLKDRVWIPAHVEYEFLKNRNIKIKRSFSDFYQPLREELKKVTEDFKNAKNHLDQLNQKIGSPKKHPFIEGLDFKSVQTGLDQVSKAYKTLEDAFLVKIQDQEKEILNLELNDTVLDRIEKYFPVGENYHSDEILEIVEEGKLRYEFKIPPGYEDLKEKEGTQIFGDLIIWKQILDHALETKRHVVFIVNDLKPDWWQFHDKEKKNKGPKNELIKEFHDQAGCDFWMYDHGTFMNKANTYLQSTITEDELQLVSSLFGEYKTATDTLSYRCSRCKKSDHISRNDLNLDFDLTEVNERQMGNENTFKSEGYFKCNYCGNDIHGIFSVHEYPEGIKDYQSVELEGATVIRECQIILPHISSINDNEIEGIEDILQEYIAEESPEELMILSSRTSIEDVTNVNILRINLEKDGKIQVKGSGNIKVVLQYGPASEEATSLDYFPFQFEAILKKTDDGYDLDKMVSLEIDNSSFYH